MKNKKVDQIKKIIKLKKKLNKLKITHQILKN